MAASGLAVVPVQMFLGYFNMNNFNIKMTLAAREHSEEELSYKLKVRAGDPVRLLREVINELFRGLIRNGNDVQLVVVDKTVQGEIFYRMKNETPNVLP